MKPTIQILFTGALALLFITNLSSCKKDDPDKTPPTIIAVAEPVADEEFLSGGEIHVEATASDDRDLSQVKIDIHSDDDGHSHGKVHSSSFFEVIKIVSVSGVLASFHEDIPIPSTAKAAKYHVILQAVDKAGNLSPLVERDIYIKNASDLIAPVISISTPSENQMVQRDATMNVIGSITDNIGLEEVEIKVYRGSSLIFSTEIDVAGTSYDLNQTVSTAAWQAGSYKLEVLAKDAVNNKTDLDIPFQVQ